MSAGSLRTCRRDSAPPRAQADAHAARPRWRARLAALVAACALGGCNLLPPYTDLAPRYAAPKIDLPPHFKEGGKWVEANPRDQLPRGPWWTAFRDRTLDGLEPQVDEANQTLAVAYANYQQSRTFVQTAEAALFPTLDQQTLLSTNRQSDHREYRASPYDGEFDYYGVNQLTVQASYEVDLWGRVRDTIKANAANAQSQAALLESVRLSLHGELARDYIALRGIDRDLQLIDATIKAYKNALDIVQTRFAAKLSASIDVDRAKAQLATAKALVEQDLGRRAPLEHAIAVLVGKPASAFAIPIAPVVVATPRGPAAAPLSLLERRPDIAAAERQVAAANEGIGIAKTAFYPRLFLNLMGGTQDRGVHLLDLANELYQIGPSVTIPIFDGGARGAQLEAAFATRDQMTAQYRQTILRAVQEVEDALAAQRYAARENAQFRDAVKAERGVLDSSLSLYRDGAASYLDVVVAQEALLVQQRASLALDTRQANALVSLFVALGGGWTEAPSEKPV